MGSHPVYAELPLLCKFNCSQLQRHVLGQVVWVDVGRRVEGLLLITGILPGPNNAVTSATL